jgi:hypothetical protein
MPHTGFSASKMLKISFFFFFFFAMNMNVELFEKLRYICLVYKSIFNIY